MESQIIIFETNKLDGIMSRNKKFYPTNMTQEEINEKFLETRINIGNKYGFDGKKIFQAIHKNKENNIDYLDGKYIIINESHMTKEDFWYEELPADILIITSEYPNIVVGNQTGDCPILIAEDRKLGIMAVSHCGAVDINREIPKKTIIALINEFKSDPKDIYVYIGTCAKKEHYIYQTYPTWATNTKVWSNSIEKQENKFQIDLINAITEQLLLMGIEHIDISDKDTITSKDYASHYATIHGAKEKLGQNFVGAYYKRKNYR